MLPLCRRPNDHVSGNPSTSNAVLKVQNTSAKDVAAGTVPSKWLALAPSNSFFKVLTILFSLQRKIPKIRKFFERNKLHPEWRSTQLNNQEKPCTMDDPRKTELPFNQGNASAQVVQDISDKLGEEPKLGEDREEDFAHCKVMEATIPKVGLDSCNLTAVSTEWSDEAIVSHEEVDSSREAAIEATVMKVSKTMRTVFEVQLVTE
ncbi:hypothetical protein COOONC_20633 [Cooperia oncophora]